MAKYKLYLPEFGKGDFFDRHEPTDYLALAYDESLTKDPLNQMILKDGEPKEFDGEMIIYMELYDSEDEDDDGMLIGSTSLPIMGTVIVKNGEVDIAIKPYNFDSSELEYEIFLRQGNTETDGEGDCIEYLSDYIISLDSEVDISPNGIKTYLLKHLEVEQIED